jgi:hypothetical protein
MPKQTRQRRGDARNWQFKGINAILNAPQPATQPRSQEEVEQRVNQAHRGGGYRKAKPPARDRGDRPPRDLQGFNTPSRAPERGNPHKAQDTTTLSALGLLGRMTRDGKPLMTTEPRLPRYGSPGKRKRGKTAERDLEEPKRHRQASPNHGTRRVQTGGHEKARSQSNTEMREHQPLDEPNHEEKSVKEDHNNTKHHKASTTQTQPPAELVSAVRKFIGADIEQQKDDRRALDTEKQKTATYPDICEEAISTPTIADKSKKTMPRPPMAKEDSADGPEALPSPPTSKSSSPITKRKRDDTEKAPSRDASKKQRLSDSRLPSPEETDQENQKPHLRKKPEPQKPGRTPRAESAFASAPTAANHECQHTHKHYNHDSVPILYSTHILHSNCPDLLNNPSPQLKVDAMLLLERGFTSKDLGRADLPEKGRGRTKVFHDVDLHLMNDGKIYVAAERGLLLAADYVKLAGIPDTTPVRFNGVKPPWVTASIAQRYVRLTNTPTSWKVTKKNGDEVYTEVPEGDLSLRADECVVEVWERDPERKPRSKDPKSPNHSGRAFGRRLDRSKEVGWFDWHHVGDFDTISTPWDGVFTAQNLAHMSAVHVPPASPGAMSVAAMNRALSTLFPKAPTGSPARQIRTSTSKTPPASSRAPSTSARATPPAHRETPAPKMTPTPTAPGTKASEKPNTDTPTITKANPTVSEQLQASVIIELVPTTGEVPAVVEQPVTKTEEQPSSFDEQPPKAKEQPAKTPEVEEAQTPHGTQLENKLAEEGAKLDAKPEASAVVHKQAVNEIATPETASVGTSTVVEPATVPAPVQRANYSKDVEDEVDWDDDEL